MALRGRRRNPNNVVNNLTWGPDGWLYGSIGENDLSWIGPPDATRNERIGIDRGIWRWHPIEREFEVLSRGPVNPWGLDFNEHGEAFFVNCVLAQSTSSSQLRQNIARRAVASE